MTSPYLVGIAAGLVAAVFHTSLSGNQTIAIALIMLLPLPVLLAGIGWGTPAGAIAVTVAASLIYVFGFVGSNQQEIATLTAVKFVLPIGLPAVFFARLINLYRHRPDAGEAGESTIEWYPVGHIVAWTAVVAGGVVMFGIATGLIKTLFDPNDPQVQHAFSQVAGDPAKLKQTIEIFERFILPASLGMACLIVWLVNIWIAAKSVAISGGLARPWPTFDDLDYPMFFLIVFLVVVGLAMLPVPTSTMASAFVGSISLAYMLIGLSVVYVLVPESPIKPLILGGVFMGLFVAGWIFVPALTLLGLGEAVLGLRRKAADRSTPPAQ